MADMVLASRVLAIAQIAFFCISMGLRVNGWRIWGVIPLLLSSVAAYFLVYLGTDTYAWFAAVKWLNLMLPFSLWLYLSFIFRVHIPLGLIAAVCIFCSVLYAIYCSVSTNQTELTVAVLATNGTLACLISHMLWRDHSHDLWSVRIRLRYSASVILGSYVIGASIFSLLIRNQLDPLGHHYSIIRFSEAAFLSVILFIVNLMNTIPPHQLKNVRGAELAQSNNELQALARAQKPIATQQQKLARAEVEIDNWSEIEAKLILAMDNERLYLEPRLSLGQLANHIKVPAYKLRILLNQEMGFDNFNEFINRYRLEYATRLLLDPHHSREKIFSIALQSGFASLAPFNKAFKTCFGVTPSQYRDDHTSEG